MSFGHYEDFIFTGMVVDVQMTTTWRMIQAGKDWQENTHTVSSFVFIYLENASSACPSGYVLKFHFCLKKRKTRTSKILSV